MNGFALNIDDSFLKTLAEVDKQMSSLMKKKTKFSKGIVEAFQEISKSGVEPFVAKLKQTQDALKAISNVPIQGKASAKLKKLQTDASLCADNVNKLILAMQVLTTSADTKREWNAFDNVQHVNKLYSERIHYMQQLESIVRKGMTSELVNTSAVTSQISTLQTKLQSIEIEIGKYNSNVKNLSKATINALTKGEADFTLAEEKELKKRLEARRKTSEEILKLENNLQKVVDKKNKLVNTSAYQSGDANAVRSYNNLIAREQDLQNKIITMRNNLGALLAEIERKYAAEGAAKEVAEIQAAEDKKLQIAKDRMAKQLAESKKYGNISSASAMRLIGFSGNATNVAQEQAAIDKLKQARNQLNKTDANYQQTLDALNKKIAEHEHNIKMATDATYRKAQADKATLQQNTTYQGAMTYSRQTKTIQEQIQAIEYLKQARDKLDKATMSQRNYEESVKRLNKEIRRQQEEVDKLRDKQGALKNSHRQLMDTTGQLQRKLALLFSVSAIQGYINKLVEVRGEFELQHKALGAIIQNTDEANRLWTKTVELAVKSPFRIKELVTYTKQLAAYRVETEKLHDTTKMLADVSSGLGVDMNRLILAYGQVKAANYLRGTELRQFSEAGINMLGELSKYFTEIENRAVSVADVFDRVSKRGVSFEDVDKVFKRITSESGIFYKMQEKQSETLKGQISNLHDSIDLMLNDIGKSNESILKGAIQFMRFFVENWESIATVVVPTLEALLVGWGTYKSLLAINSASSIIFFSNMQKHLKATIILLTRGTTSLQAFARMSNITPFGAWGIVIGVVTAALTKLGVTFFEHKKAINDINKKYDELIDKTYKVSTSFMEASRSGGISEMKSKLLELVEIASKDYNMDIQVDVKGMSVEEVKNKFEELRQQILDMNSFSALLETAFEKSKQWVITDDIEEDFKELGQAYSNISQQMLSSRARVVAMLSQNEEELNQQQKEALSVLRDGIKENETELEYVERIGKAYEKLLNANQEIRKEILKRVELQGSVGKRAELELRIFNENAKKMGLSLDVWRPLFVDFNESIKEAEKEYREFIKSISDDINSIPEEERTVVLQAAIDKMSAEKRWSEFVETTIKGWMNTDFSVDLVIRTKKAEQKLEEWQKTYNANFGDNIITEDNNEALYGFKKIENAATKQAEVIERLQGEWGELNKTIIAVEKAGENATKKGGMYEGVNKGLLEQRKREVELQLDAFGADYEKKRKSQGKDWLSEVVKSLKEAHQEYIKLNKTLSESESKQMALDKYAKSFAESAKNAGLKDISLGQFKFDTEEGAIEALNFLKNKLPQSAKQARFKLEEAIGEIRGEVRIRTKAEDDKILIEQIEDMFSGYEMSIELQKLNIPPDLAKQLFNVDSFDLSSIRSKIESDLAKARSLGGKGDLIKELEEKLKKVEDLENKAQQERLKKYTKYLLKAQSERVKIKMEELRQIAEIEKENAYTDSQKETIKRNLQIETQEKIDKQAWDDFKNSEMYTQMFSDLEHLGTESIKRLKASLESLKESLSELPASDLKEIMQQISKLEELEIERNPFTSMRDAMKEVDELKKKGRTEKFVQEELATTQARIDSSKAEVDAINVVLNARKEGLSLETQSVEWQDNYRHLIMASNEQLQDRLNYLERSVEKDKKIAQQAGIDAEAYVKARKATKGFTDNVSKWGEAIKGVLGGIDEVLDAFGVVEDDTARLWVNNAMQIADMIVQVVILTASLQAMGVAANSALGVVGWVAMALQGVAMIFASIFGMGDKKKERQIQREMDLVSDLEQAYKKLERAIDNAYSLDTLERSGANAKNNIQAQIRSYYRMIEAEEDKKKTDDDRIKEWEQTIDDLKMQLEDLNKELVSTATAGIMDSVLEASKEFTDAWLEAFNETGDGLSGLEENFKSTMLEMVKQQAAMLISQAYVERWKKQLEQYINTDDLELSTDEAKRWVNAVTTSLPQLNEALEKYFTAMQQAGVDIGGGGDSELSGLQRGIQGVTEETAQILEAYLNSIRFFVAEQNTYLAQIASSFGSTEMENPMVEQLRIIASQTTAINTLLQSLTRGGHTLGGVGLKVFIN